MTKINEVNNDEIEKFKNILDNKQLKKTLTINRFNELYETKLEFLQSDKLFKFMEKFCVSLSKIDLSRFINELDNQIPNDE